MLQFGFTPMVHPTGHFNFARDVIELWAQQRPDAPALWWVNESSNQQKFTFANLAELGRRAACGFAKAGVQKGDRVLVILPRVPQWWIGMLGLIRLGAVPIPGTPLLTPSDIAYPVAAADVHAIFTASDGARKVEDFQGIRFLVGGKQPGWIDFDAAVHDADPTFDPPQTLADDDGIIYFTSGTTGHPTTVLHTHPSYVLGRRATGH